jgi:lysophospholipase L1-like esterase
VATWGASPQRTETDNVPPIALANATLRQKAYVSIGGEQLRLGLSNEFGSGPVTLHAVHVARASSALDSSIDATTDAEIAFEGSTAITIAPGQAVKSDPFAFSLPAQSVVAITIHFGDVPSGLTGHPGSRTTSYVARGQALATAPLSDAISTDHWYYIQGIDVLASASAGAVVTLGDSITDGRGSTTNGNDRWPDALSRRLRANRATANVAVVNAGIGGNAVSSGGLGPTARDRFERDVISQAGVRWVIVLAGVNDIGGNGSAATAQNLISAYQQFIARAHDAGLLILGVPILPFGGSSYDSASSRKARETVNQWMRSSGAFDQVLDLDAALAQPNDPERLRPEYHDGDGLHLGPAGHQAFSDAIDLALFERD